ncbi:MAG TPA: SDR family oxidoreductase [Bryobacteraceae bacterium]|jgi:nucleoside-diphosphate-sugar epimerase
MQVFVTGATGFIGSAVVPELINAGHQVLGLTRTDAGAKSLLDAGAQVHRGDLEDLESLRSGAAMADGVIHLAFNHDFSKFAANCEMDRLAIEALGSALVGSDRPLVVTSGTGLIAPGRLATEDDVPSSGSTSVPRVSEQTAASLAARGVRASVVRLPQVHNRLKQGLVSYMIAAAREKGVSAFVGDGLNRWPAVPLLDAAHLYRLVLEKTATTKESAGARYHAVAEEGVPLREIAEAIGRGLKAPVVAMSPEEAGRHFGFLGFFVGADCPASSALTQEWLGWRPTMQPGLIADLDRAHVFEAAQ